MLEQQLINKFVDFYNKKTIKNNTCIEWGGTIGNNGYGYFYFKNKKYLTHRLSYLIFKKENPNNLFVCHTCDNRKCINPDHLWLGTCADNLRDIRSKGRQSNQNKYKFFCKNGHEFNDLNTIIRKTKKRSYRVCSICEKEYGRIRYLNKIGRPLLGVRTHCNKGHEWIEENIYIRPDGEKNCQICRKTTKKNYDEKRKYEMFKL